MRDNASPSVAADQSQPARRLLHVSTNRVIYPFANQVVSQNT